MPLPEEIDASKDMNPYYQFVNIDPFFLTVKKSYNRQIICLKSAIHSVKFVCPISIGAARTIAI